MEWIEVIKVIPALINTVSEVLKRRRDKTDHEKREIARKEIKNIAEERKIELDDSLVNLLSEFLVFSEKYNLDAERLVEYCLIKEKVHEEIIKKGETIDHSDAELPTLDYRNRVIKHLDLSNSKIKRDVNISNGKIFRLDASNSEIMKLDCAYAIINLLDVSNSRIEELNANGAIISILDVSKANIGTLRIINAKIENLDLSDAKIEVFEDYGARIDIRDTSRLKIGRPETF